MPLTAQIAPPQPHWAVSALLTRGTRRLALAALSISVVFPVGGLGVDLCAFHAATQLPCPGCGLSRGLASLTQGDVATAVALHPFVLVVWPLFLALSVLALLPEARVEEVRTWLTRRTRLVEQTYRLLLAAFVGFGVLRLVVMALVGATFP